MTVEKFLGKTGDEIAAMSDAEILEYFKPVLHITRPDLANKPEKKSFNHVRSSSISDKMLKVMEIARQHGLNLDEA